MKIRRINYEQAKDFIKVKWLTVNPQYLYYALFDDIEMVSVIALDVKGKKVTIHANYTPEQYRGKGYFTLSKTNPRN